MEMKLTNKTQVSVFEIILVIFLFFSSITYYGFYNYNYNSQVHKVQIESFLDGIAYGDNFRVLIMSEDLSQNTITGNWTNFTILLNNSFTSYELIISNKTVSKTIVSCNETSGKYYIERFIALKDNSYYEFRKIKLGVCY